jgi:hypothetical protein
MRKFALLAGIALLAACQQKAEAPAAEDTGSAAAAAPAAVQSPDAGTYDVVNPDGTKGVSVLNADGTYEDQDADGKATAKGTWAVKDGKTCFQPEGKAEECYTESARAADGSFTATDAKGATVKVTPRAK